MLLRRFALLLAIASTSCATTPYVAPFPAALTRPGAGEAVLVRDSILIFDASGSIDRKLVFPAEKALLESFVAGMPPGTYDSALFVLGGRPRDQLPMERFDRWHLREQANRLPFGGRETPLAAVLQELGENLDRGPGRVALVIFSDGVPTRNARYVGPEQTLTAARRLLARHEGAICYHTILVGSDPRGPALLQGIAGLSECGSFHALHEIDGPEALQAFQRHIYIGPAPPPKPPAARRMTDLDRDGVDDRFDRCARTPLGARVDERGCWVIEDYVFETNSAHIADEHRDALEDVLEVLLANPELRIRLDGHTDDTGEAGYNFDLAERRASAVGAYLQSAGIDATRLRQRSFGPTRPIASNDTAEGRRKNRRVELSIIDW